MTSAPCEGASSRLTAARAARTTGTGTHSAPARAAVSPCSATYLDDERGQPRREGDCDQYTPTGTREGSQGSTQRHPFHGSISRLSEEGAPASAIRPGHRGTPARPRIKGTRANEEPSQGNCEYIRLNKGHLSLAAIPTPAAAAAAAASNREGLAWPGRVGVWEEWTTAAAAAAAAAAASTRVART